MELEVGRIRVVRISEGKLGQRRRPTVACARRLSNENTSSITVAKNSPPGDPGVFLFKKLAAKPEDIS